METARKTFELNNDVKVSKRRFHEHLHSRISAMQLSQANIVFARVELLQELMRSLQVDDPTEALFQYGRDEEKVLEDQSPWRDE